MKYRRLTNEELAELEKEFIRFLASNSVTGEDWERIKNEDAQKAERLIDIFSDIVFEKTISKLEYLEFKTPTDIKIFHCREEEIEMMGLLTEGNSGIDFTKNKSPEQMLGKIKLAGGNLKLYTAKKKYKKSRELEIFDMMQWGCLISDGELFKTLQSLKPK